MKEGVKTGQMCLPKPSFKEEPYAVVRVEVGACGEAGCLLPRRSTKALGPGFDLIAAGRSYCTDGQSLRMWCDPA